MTARYLGFDFGTRRIGVASGQRLTGRALPITTLAARRGLPDWAEMDALLEAWGPAALVVGLPTRRDGSDSAVSEGARRFARRAAARYRLPAHLIDERLSSHAAQERLAAGERGDRDSLAACVILERWLAAR